MTLEEYIEKNFSTDKLNEISAFSGWHDVILEIVRETWQAAQLPRTPDVVRCAACKSTNVFEAVICLDCCAHTASRRFRQPYLEAKQQFTHDAEQKLTKLVKANAELAILTATLIEFVHEVSYTPYSDSNYLSLFENLRTRATVILQDIEGRKPTVSPDPQPKSAPHGTYEI